MKAKNISTRGTAAAWVGQGGGARVGQGALGDQGDAVGGGDPHGSLVAVRGQRVAQPGARRQQVQPRLH